MCSALDNHIFEYGQKASSDQMITTWEKLVHHVGTIHGHNISNWLLNKKTVIITKPGHTQYALDEHQLATGRRDQSYQRSAEARQFHKGLFEYQVMEEEPTISDKTKVYLAILKMKLWNPGIKVNTSYP